MVTNKTNYDEIIPTGVLFDLNEIQNMKLLKVRTARDLIEKGALEVVKIGTKIFVSRIELIRFLEANTFVKSA
ncbi:helix-turn-helix domain-containing protein [Aliarcobacter cryaerophilus]|uniref:helix-turn-helix domain-containing protein n=1 Tax=Aliarcobacter cryaerophilus TaxID=28198 RepID=UPI0021B305B3|nr:helix-turn-helix domain-containing protein [Aliarcobacter cryaerophilus]MCT7467886.1 helix-turn-helix domain-containing protein [Aliarcobacter cryaerophilus]